MVPDAPKGYALFMVLVFLTLLFILTTAFCLTLHVQTQDSKFVVADTQSLTAADSGLQYALEAIRQKQSISTSQALASWNLLNSENGKTTCFKVFSNGFLDPGHLRIISFGEVVDGVCGDYGSAPESVISAKILQAVVDLTPGHEALTQWQVRL